MRWGLVRFLWSWAVATARRRKRNLRRATTDPDSPSWSCSYPTSLPEPYAYDRRPIMFQTHERSPEGSRVRSWARSLGRRGAGQGRLPTGRCWLLGSKSSRHTRRVLGPFLGTETSPKTLNARAELVWQSRQTHEVGPGAVFVVVGSRNGNSRRASNRPHIYELALAIAGDRKKNI